MKTVKPLDLYDLTGSLCSLRDRLREVQQDRKDPNYLGTQGARMTLQKAREIAAIAEKQLNDLVNLVGESCDDHGVYRLVSPLQFGIKKSTYIFP